jgi:hypothetical protein
MGSIYLHISPSTVGTILCRLHCKEIWFYVFPEKELRGLSYNFHIYVSVIDLYIPMFSTPIVLQQNRQTDQGGEYTLIIQ